MTITTPRTPLTRLLTASALSLALLGGITACAPTNSSSQPPGDGNHGPSVTTATATPSMSISEKIKQDNKNTATGFVTKVISSRVVEFTPSNASWVGDLTGKEPSFRVLMDDSAPRPGKTCDEARGIEILKIPSDNGYVLQYRDTANGQLNSEGQRQGIVFNGYPSDSLASDMLSLSCSPRD